MNRIIYILLTIVFFQLIGIGYMKIIDKQQKNKPIPITIEEYNHLKLNKLVNESIQDILTASKKLPQSTEYTVWDKKTIEDIGKKVLNTIDNEKIDSLTQKILQESKVDTITIVKEENKKENKIALNKKTNNKPIKNKTVIKIATNKIKNITQKILQESKVDTLTVVKEENIKTEEKIKNKSLKNKTIVKIALIKVKKEKKRPMKVTINKKELLKKKKIISVTQKVEKYAKKQLGQKYVWGATGPNRFDCSGFTRYVFRSTAGIKIPRVSRDQAKVGKYIKSIKDLRRGDMVFFDTEKKFKGKVNHVGIYLSNGNFIHASSARKKVIITNFNKKPFYKRRFLWGRRVINSKCKKS